eukprot:scaffold248_cov111-Cylindrotheca_fusiformis.AAC.9
MHVSVKGTKGTVCSQSFENSALRSSRMTFFGLMHNGALPNDWEYKQLTQWNQRARCNFTRYWMESRYLPKKK